MSETSSPARSARWPAIESVLPIVGFLRASDRTSIRADLLAGISVATMLVPQGMAYAALAGMPPVTGLYASIVPIVVYALLGTSGSLAVGPVAITALMTASAIAPLAGGDPGRYIALAGLLALLVGAVHLILGLLRLGVLVSFMSHSVLSGFTSAAAIVIAASQLSDLLGIDAARAETLPEIASSLAGSLGSAHGLTIGVSLAGIAVLVSLRRFMPRAPASLIIVIAATALSAGFTFSARGVPIVGEVPAGLPVPDVPSLEPADVTALLPSALAIAVISYMEGIAVAKVLAAKARQRIDPNQELIAVGGANIAAGIFQAFPVAGGFSRSAVNHQSGARTPVASIVTAAIVATTAFALTPLFHHLPQAVLGAIVVVAVLGLIDHRTAIRAWRARRSDGVTVLVTFLATLTLGVEPGLATGIAFSLAVFLWRSARPHTAELGRVPGSRTYRNIERYDTQTDPAVLLLRIDAPLYFANAQQLAERIVDAVAQRSQVRSVVLDAAAISDADADGAHALEQLRERLAGKGVTLHLATVRGPVRDLLDRAGLWHELTARNLVHRDIPEALSTLDLPAGSVLRSDGGSESGSRTPLY